MLERDEFTAAYKAAFEEKGFESVATLCWQIWQAARAMFAANKSVDKSKQ